MIHVSKLNQEGLYSIGAILTDIIKNNIILHLTKKLLNNSTRGYLIIEKLLNIY